MKSFTSHLLKLFSLLVLSLSFQKNVSAQTTVVIPGDFQSEVGCPSDWQPDCDATRLTPTGAGIWEGTFLIPAGAWQYKVAYDNSWTENYGDGGVRDGANMVLVLGSPTSVHFSYSSVTHLITLTYNAPSVTLAGSFQSELGCPGDWQPDCSASSLLYDATTNTWFGMFTIPAGNWEFKVALNNSWTENYGAGGIPGGANIPLNLELPATITFSYDPQTHLVTLFFETTSLCATAFYDANANGWKDFDEMPMEGVSFTLTGMGTQVTGSDGKTCFGNLAPGMYTIQEAVPASYLPTNPALQTVELNYPQTFNFGMVCLGGAGAENIAFWMNKNGRNAFNNLAPWQQEYILSYLRYLNLRNADGSDFDPLNFEELQTWLQRANAKNIAYKLSAQLAVLFLNTEAFMLGNRTLHTPGIQLFGFDYNFMNVNWFIFYVNQQLFANSFGSDANRSQHEELYKQLEQANEDLNFVQLQPCGNNVTTAVQSRQTKDLATIATSPELTIWPNPTASDFILRLSGHNDDGPVRMAVWDMQGKRVYNTTGSQQQEYCFGKDFRPGLYVVEVTQGNQRYLSKIIKQ